MTILEDGPAYDVAPLGDGVQVHGFDQEEVLEALRLRAKVLESVAVGLPETREELLAVLMRHEVPLTPPASFRQVRRLAALRTALLSSPAHTYESLAEVRAEQIGTTRTWFSRRRADQRIFSVQDQRRSVIPAFLVTEDGEVREDLTEVLRPLLSAGLDGWTVWSWLTHPTSLLSGGVPEEIAVKEPVRAATAARRFAAQHSS